MPKNSNSNSIAYEFNKRPAKTIPTTFDPIELRDANNKTPVLNYYCSLQKTSHHITNPFSSYLASVREIINDGGLAVIIITSALQQHTIRVNNHQMSDSEINEELNKEASHLINHIKLEFDKEDYEIILWQDITCQQGFLNARAEILLKYKSEPKYTSAIENTVADRIKNRYRNHSLSTEDRQHIFNYVIEETAELKYRLSIKDVQGNFKYRYLIHSKGLNQAMDLVIRDHNEIEVSKDDESFKFCIYEPKEIKKGSNNQLLTAREDMVEVFKMQLNIAQRHLKSLQAAFQNAGEKLSSEEVQELRDEIHKLDNIINSVAATKNKPKTSPTLKKYQPTHFKDSSASVMPTNNIPLNSGNNAHPPMENLNKNSNLSNIM